jgi:hypothetical protein
MSTMTTIHDAVTGRHLLESEQALILAVFNSHPQRDEMERMLAEGTPLSKVPHGTEAPEFRIGHILLFRLPRRPLGWGSDDPPNG